MTRAWFARKGFPDETIGRRIPALEHSCFGPGGRVNMWDGNVALVPNSWWTMKNYRTASQICHAVPHWSSTNARRWWPALESTLAYLTRGEQYLFQPSSTISHSLHSCRKYPTYSTKIAIPKSITGRVGSLDTPVLCQYVQGLYPFIFPPATQVRLSESYSRQPSLTQHVCQAPWADSTRRCSDWPQ